MYYLDGKSQAEIAAEYEISRPTVANILKQCREEGIVEIRIEDSSSSLVSALSNQLQAELALETVTVVPSEGDPLANLVSTGKAAGELLHTLLEDSMEIGISWGTSLYQLVSNISRKSYAGIEVIQMVGGLGADNVNMDGFELAQALAKKLNGTYKTIQAPICVQTRELKEMLEEEHRISQVLEKMTSIDIALVGISSDIPESSSLVREGFISVEEQEKILKAGAVGHICGYHYDKQGKFLLVSANERVVGVGKEELKGLPRVIGVAAGAQKGRAILGAARGGIINGIVTDEAAALAILSSLKR
jgi:DNA-binding transcriptional regulator LsrR (DeoR family)